MRLSLLLFLLLVSVSVFSACTMSSSEKQADTPSQIAESEAPAPVDNSTDVVNPVESSEEIPEDNSADAVNPGQSSEETPEDNSADVVNPAESSEEIPEDNSTDVGNPAQSSEEIPDTSVSTLPEEARISKIVPMGDPRLASFPSTDLRIGLQEGLDAWKKIISDAVRIDVCNMHETEEELTDEQFRAVITTLSEATITTYESVGNPMTGGSSQVVAYDASGAKIWKISYDGAWLVVNIGRGYTEIFNGEDPTLMNLKMIF